MMRLFRIELHKIIFNRAFWVIIGIYASLLAMVAYTMGKFNTQMDSSLGFSYVWHTIGFLGRCFNVFLVLILVNQVSAEFRYKTLRQHIIDGMSKWEIIWAKQLLIVFLSVITGVFLFLITFFFFLPQSIHHLTEGIEILPAYMISLCLFLNMAYSMALWLKKSGFVMGMLLLYTFLIEDLFIYKFEIPKDIARYFPVQLISKMVPNVVDNATAKSDLSLLNLGFCLLYIFLFVQLNHWMLKRGQAGK